MGRLSVRKNQHRRIPERRPTRLRVAAAGLVLIGAAGPASCRPASEPAASYEAARERMVSEDIARLGVEDPRVLAAMRRVPRHEFVPPAYRPHAYENRPLPIGEGQTISQPYVVAAMTEALALSGGERVLEVGTGSGYQAAVLAEIAGEVLTIEIVPVLAEQAKARLARLGYRNVTVRHGDGYRGWPELAPFEAIIVTAAPGEIPQPLVDQLAPGGRMVIPVGPPGDQRLYVVTRDERGVRKVPLMDVRFVPMTGEAQSP